LAEEPATTLFLRLCLVRHAVLPRWLGNTRNFPSQRQPAEAEPAKAELSQEGTRTSANLAAVVLAW